MQGTANSSSAFDAYYKLADADHAVSDGYNIRLSGGSNFDDDYVASSAGASSFNIFVEGMSGYVAWDETANFRPG